MSAMSIFALAHTRVFQSFPLTNERPRDFARELSGVIPVSVPPSRSCDQFSIMRPLSEKVLQSLKSGRLQA